MSNKLDLTLGEHARFIASSNASRVLDEGSSLSSLPDESVFSPPVEGDSFSPLSVDPPLRSSGGFAPPVPGEDPVFSPCSALEFPLEFARRRGGLFSFSFVPLLTAPNVQVEHATKCLLQAWKVSFFSLSGSQPRGYPPVDC